MVGNNEALTVSDTLSFINAPTSIMRGTTSLTLQSTDANNVILQAQPTNTTFNPGMVDRDFIVTGTSASTIPLTYDAGNHTLTTDATLVGFGGGGADGLSITDTVNLNLLDGTTVLSTVMLPSAGGTTVVQGTANEIDVTTVGDTNTLSLATVVTTAISDNTTAIALNTAKNSYPTADATKLATIATNADVTLDSISAGNNITISSGGVIAATGSGTADSVVRQPAGSTIAPIKFWTGTQAQYNALTPVNDVLYNITDTAEITLVSSVVGTADEVDVTTIDGQATVSLDSLITGAITANTSKLSGIEAGADVTDTTNVVGSLTAGTNITIATDGTISATSGGTTTTVQGTTNQIDVNTIGSTATVSLDTAITSAITTNTAKTGITTIQSGEITANTAKIGLESLNQVAGAIIGSDSIAYLDNTTPRRKPFNQVPLSIFNNDAGFTNNAGIVTSINGTTNEVDVTSGATPTVSLSSTITDAIDANTSKTGITTAQASAITANTAKVGITTAQSSAITTNTAKVGITTAQASAITANTNKTGITSAQASAITNNTVKVGITTAQATAITNNTAKTGITTTQAANIVTNNAKTGITNAQANAIVANTAKQSVAGLNQVGGAIVASDSILYYDNTTPRRKVFSSVPLSVFNNDAGFSTSSGTVTSVSGTNNQVNVASGTTTPVISLDSSITSAITANTSKTGISTAQASAIVANTAKVTYTDLLPLNNTFTGNNTFTQGIAREAGGSTTNGIKFWSGTEAQYNTLGTGRDQNTIYYLTDI